MKEKNNWQKIKKIIVILCFTSALSVVVIILSVIWSINNVMSGPQSPSSSISLPPMPPVSLPEPPIKEPEPPEEVHEEPFFDPMEGMVFSPFNGLPIAEELFMARPYAVVLNNYIRAQPQAGISQAQIVYEVLSEGDITRLIAIFHDFSAERVGSVRSTREYFADFAADFDAIFVHFGGSISGYNRLARRNVDRLDGIALDGTVFWRDPIRRAIPGMLEHSAYTSAENVIEHAERQGFRKTRSDNHTFGFGFEQTLSAYELMLLGGGEISQTRLIYVPFSNAYTRIFSYDEENKVYAVENINGPHIDEDAGELTVKNILIQSVQMRVIPGDDAGRREMFNIGSGSGFWAAEGRITPVLWSRDSETSPTKWYFMNGEPLEIAPGNVWICVLQSSAQPRIIANTVQVIE